LSKKEGRYNWGKEGEKGLRGKACCKENGYEREGGKHGLKWDRKGHKSSDFERTQRGRKKKKIEADGRRQNVKRGGTMGEKSHRRVKTTTAEKAK